MKIRKSTKQYDLELNNKPLHATLDRRPAGVKHTLIHHTFFFFWLFAGISTIGLIVVELKTSMMYTAIISMASNQLADFFGLDPETISGLASDALVKGKLFLLGGELFMAVLFFVCAYYCRRLVARSRYIEQLEGAALIQTQTILKEEEKEYVADLHRETEKVL